MINTDAINHNLNRKNCYKFKFRMRYFTVDRFNQFEKLIPTFS